MIYGVVNLRREATLPLVIGNSTGQREVINTVIDTGFDGFLSLPSEIIMRLDCLGRFLIRQLWAMAAKPSLIFTPEL